jgi:hypothetical protein
MTPVRNTGGVAMNTTRDAPVAMVSAIEKNAAETRATDAGMDVSKACIVSVYLPEKCVDQYPL